MRLHLKINTNNEIIKFNHQQYLTGAIHKWLGWNNEHGNISLYSFSRLEGGKISGNGLQFKNGASFFFSSYSPELLKKMIVGIKKSPELFNGFNVSEIIIQKDPDLSERSNFFAASPIFIKRRLENKITHITFNNPNANRYLKETLITRMAKAGIKNTNFEIKFDKNYPKAKTKKITYKGVENRANSCPVIIKGNQEIKLFAWNVGLGNSTGIGFGAIK